MVDWMLQVLRALRVSCDQTLFLAISLMDRYFQAKGDEGCVLAKDSLHLTGLVAIFLSSKFEDVIPLDLEHLIKRAAFGKFVSEDVLSRETDMLLALTFRIQSDNVFLRSFTKLKAILQEF